ncbi:hypothetical protein [Actinomyces sp. oral taxon 414]|uniref:hypothetical protein n=1 Tax=Actinomyces sp. oral taxon 414 TaxID=712122 RepID=UPI0009FABE67|nr:hypothetical protein [Actinomyces sp. oral taxon 414]
MSRSPTRRTADGVLLALTGEDAAIVQALDDAGSGLKVVRRCGDVAELLGAALAGLARLAVLDTGFDDLDRTVLDRLERCDVAGVLLVDDDEERRWAAAGWATMPRRVDPVMLRARLQLIARRGGGQGAPTLPPAGPRTAAASDSASAFDSAASAAVSADPSGARMPDPPGGARPASAPDAGRPGAGWDADDRPPASQPGRDGPARPRTSGTAGRPLPGSPPDAGAEAARPREGRLAVVWGPHGAPGRTTVAASLAHGLARAGGSVLVDADVEAPSLVQVLGLPEDSSSLATAARLASHSRLDTESLVGLLVPVGPDHSLLSGLGRSGRWRELPPSPMADVWAGCREVAAWTVIDIAGGPLEDEVDDYTLEPGRDALAASLVRSADVVVIVGAADPVGVRRLLQLVAQFDETERPSGRIEVVVNRVRASAAGPSPERAVREALARFGGLEEVVLLPEDPVADQCLLAGCSVLDGAPGSALGRALAVLVDRIDPAAGARRTASRRRRRGFLRRLRDRRAERRARARPPAPAAGPDRGGAAARETAFAPVAPVSAPEASAPGVPGAPAPASASLGASTPGVSASPASAPLSPASPGMPAPASPASAPPLPFAVFPPGAPAASAIPTPPGASAPMTPAPPPPLLPPMAPRTMPFAPPPSATPPGVFPPSAATPFTAPSSATSPAPRPPSPAPPVPPVPPSPPPVPPSTAQEAPQRISRKARRPFRRRKGRHAS